MAKLVDVYRSEQTLSRRQLPLVVDESLTMVMDLKNLGLISDSHHVKGKEMDEINRKIGLLTQAELNSALEVTRPEILHVLNQSVPCVGCRRSVERLYYQLYKYGYPTLDPIVVKSDGIITVKEDKKNSAQFLCGLFHGHSVRLDKLVDAQPRRHKKSHRCLLHSLDSQRTRQLLTSAWREVWECMRPDCRRDVCIIEASCLSATLDTYLRKHRFCSECRTKVLKAYSLLMDEPEPTKERGYTASLYSGIKRCLPERHIHLPSTKTDYIGKLIGRAEPELFGSRRERHAKTLEIAQEEVLTCIGICMYERLNRVHLRLREEECTCRVLAAVAVDALWRRFETVVETKQGISQLDLLYAELTREEQQKQQRKEQKKLRRKRKKVVLEKPVDDDEEEEEEDIDEEIAKTTTKKPKSLNNNLYNKHDDDQSDEDDDFEEDEDEFEEEEEYLEHNFAHLNDNCCQFKVNKPNYTNGCHVKSSATCNINGNNGKPAVNNKSKSGLELPDDVNCKCQTKVASKKQGHKSVVDCKAKVNGNIGRHVGGVDSCCGSGGGFVLPMENNNGAAGGCCGTTTPSVPPVLGGVGGLSLDVTSGSSSSCSSSNSVGGSAASSPNGCSEEVGVCHRCSVHSGGGAGEGEAAGGLGAAGGAMGANGGGTRQQLSLMEMLDDPFYCDNDSCYITQEEMNEFKTKNRQVTEKRLELRETLQKRFAQLCVNGSVCVPRLLTQNLN